MCWAEGGKQIPGKEPVTLAGNRTGAVLRSWGRAARLDSIVFLCLQGLTCSSAYRLMVI